ncbi:MAG: NTP transferase domain-containing protein [Thaumarchaeota archaeon]|nr:NTP transferase domain-containing protein [Nitrososphaerota archaeon]
MIGMVMAGGRGSRMAASAAAATAAKNDGSLPESSPHAADRAAWGEKLLLPVVSYAASDAGAPKPVVSHVIDVLLGSDQIDTVVAVVSQSNAPLTRRMLWDKYHNSGNDADGDDHDDDGSSSRSSNDRSIRIVDSAGAGYSDDLGSAMRHVLQNRYRGIHSGVFVVSGDMPLLDRGVIASVSARYARGAWTSIVTSREYAGLWGMSLEYEVVVDGTVCCYTGVSLVDPVVMKPDAHDAVPQRHAIVDDHRIAFTLNTVQDYDRLAQHMRRSGIAMP